MPDIIGIKLIEYYTLRHPHPRDDAASLSVYTTQFQVRCCAMNTIQSNDDQSLIPWKHYVSVTIESLLTFYLATFCIAMFFTHRGTNWISSGILMALLYLFVIFVCAKRVMQKLPLASLMLIIPLAPLIALIIIVSLIPILQLF